ncbi:YcaO-like family protein [Allorhizocola rhizosphaerae]|uniref:YcaO-like family protein n=1 Tax=Allorhizocola rhizosphaerae TaxID=1872709 RepID=UPI000E3B94BC|nr:YcaO-like family protein [Allorhizocola rhizosphaerae]
MTIDVTYLNEHIELFDHWYDECRAAEFQGAVRLYNRLIGPVTSLTLIRPEVADLSMYSAFCRHVPIEGLIRDLHVKNRPIAAPVAGGGKGANPLRPILGALGEMAERLLAVMHFTSLAERVRYGSYTEMTTAGFRAIEPQRLPLFAAEQYNASGFIYERFTTDARLGWVEGIELLSGQSIWVPAQLVLMYYRTLNGETPIGYATTAGLASHTSARSSILHGLFEVIERDALNLRWYSGLAPSTVDVDLESVLGADLDVPRARMSSPHLDMKVFDLTLDSTVPVLAVTGIDRSRRERAFVGGTGAAANRSEALGQALFELGQCQTGFHFEDPFGRNPILADTELADVKEFFDAPLFYGHAGNLPRVQWFTAGTERVGWADIPTLSGSDEKVYETMLSWLRQRGFHPIVFEFGDACPSGMSLTKVFVPELTQACPPRNPMLGHPRFLEMPQTLGLERRRLSFADLKTDPIPFA